jgi:hypothetical protein
LTNRWDQWEPPGHETGDSLDQRGPLVH